jgi:hypothetical protein
MLDITDKLTYRMECRFIKNDFDRQQYLGRVPSLYAIFYELHGMFDVDYD